LYYHNILNLFFYLFFRMPTEYSEKCESQQKWGSPRIWMPRRIWILSSSAWLHTILCVRFRRRFTGIMYGRPYVQVCVWDQKYEYDGESSEKKKITIVTNMRTIQHFISECFSKLIFNVEKSNASLFYSNAKEKISWKIYDSIIEEMLLADISLRNTAAWTLTFSIETLKIARVSVREF